jgi:aspartyl-tRNA(Asn)/glutamyl-tRNA(Gln) amidotransferase subunit A
MFAPTRGAGFGAEVQRRILLGTYALSAGYADEWYRHALKARRKLANEYATAFESCDVIVSPTTPGPAFELGEKARDPLAMYLSDLLTVQANLTGLPAVSVPCGFTSGPRPLPVGLQFTGPSLGDARVLSVARVFEGATDHRRVAGEAVR